MAKRIGNDSLVYKTTLMGNLKEFDCNDAHICQKQSAMIFEAKK